MQWLKQGVMIYFQVHDDTFKHFLILHFIRKLDTDPIIPRQNIPHCLCGFVDIATIGYIFSTLYYDQRKHFYDKM